MVFIQINKKIIVLFFTLIVVSITGCTETLEEDPIQLVNIVDDSSEIDSSPDKLPVEPADVPDETNTETENDSTDIDINEEYNISQGWKIHSFYYNNNEYYMPVPTIENQDVQSLYKYYTSQPRKHQDYSYYSIIDADVGKVYANYFNEYAEKNDFDEWEKVSLVLAFVQSLPYTSDSVTTGYDEYPRFPIETLIDNGGDCEDTSILLASILRSMDYNTVLLTLPEHMAVGVAVSEELVATWNQDYSLSYYTDEFGNIYAYAETTGSGYEIGQIPEEYEKSQVIIEYTYAKPELDISFTYDFEYNSQDVYVDVDMNLENIGSGDAENIKIYTSLQTSDTSRVWDEIESSYIQIPSGGSNTYTVDNLHAPTGRNFRVYVAVYGDNVKTEELIGDWVTWN